MTLRRSLLLLGLACVLGLALNVLLYAQEVPPSPPVGISAQDGIIDRETKWIVAQFGFAGLLLIVFFFVWKRLTPVESLIANYEKALQTMDKTQAAHLAAFKDITENYRALSSDTKDTMLLNVQVQTRLVEKLEAMERTHVK